jgi:cytochrome c oxidase subunit II
VNFASAENAKEASVMVQEVVWSISIVLMGALAALFAWVAVGASDELADYGPVVASAYRARTWLFALAVIVLIGVNWNTFGKLPYVSSMSASAATAGILPADAVGEQWAWTIKPNAFRVGQTAEFHVTSKDVNHGFAIYDPEMRIVAQVQAMPGYTNVLRYTFTEPGVYRVLCLEYCGVAHHEMNAEINVAAK